LILVDRSDHSTRQRFTLAHELGHLLLPWHLGSNFACDPSQDRPELWQDSSYEPEANRFAAELLVPSAWLDRLIETRGDDTVAGLAQAVLDAGVSTWVASFRLAGRLPAGHVFAVIDSSNQVIISGQTQGTGIGAPPSGQPLERDRLDAFASAVEEIPTASRRMLWWTFRGGAEQFVSPKGDAAEVLKSLAGRHGTDDASRRRLIQRCGGIVGYAYGMEKKKGDLGAAHLLSVFRGRFARERGLPPGLLEDSDFELWLKLRAAELSDS
jgi:IrrE N-terminal-like domain